MSYSLTAISFSLNGPSEDNLNSIEKYVRRYGLKVLVIVDSPDEDARYLADKYFNRYRPGLRWTHIAFCLDQRPQFSGHLQYDTDNARVLKVVGLLTDESSSSNKQAPNDWSDLIVGWSQGTREAWHIAQVVCPKKYLGMRDSVLETIDALLPPFPVVRDLSSRGIHAKVYLVRYNGRLAVCKVFRSGSTGELARETRGLELSRRIKGIPRLIRAHDNWILMEYLQDYHELKPGLMGFFPIRPVRAAFGHLEQIHDEGCFLLDFHIGNVLASKTDAKIVDLEQLYDYPIKPPTFEQSPAIVGSDYFKHPEVSSALKSMGSRLGNADWYPNYDKSWLPALGVSLNTLLRGSRMRIVLERLRYVLAVKVPRKIGSYRRSLSG